MILKNKQLSLFIFFGVLIFTSNIGFATSIEDFVEKYMEARGVIKREQELIQGQKSSLKLTNRFYSARLKANVDTSVFDFKFPGDITYDINQNNFGLSLEQEFSTGTLFSFGGDFRHADRSDRDDNQQNFDFDIRLSQSLRRNWLGRLNSTQITVIKAQNKIEYLQEKKRVIRSCLLASELFISSYFENKRRHVIKQLVKDSSKIRRTSKDKFKKKLIDKLDFLQSIVDYQQSTSQLLLSHQSIEIFSKELRLYDRLIDVEKLAEPRGFNIDANNTQLRRALGQSLDYEQQIAQLAFFQSQTEQVKAQNTWDLSLEAFLGASQKRNDFSFSNVGDNKRDNLGVGLKLDIPLYDSSLKSRLKNQMIKLRGQELNIAELKIDLEFEKERYFSLIKQNLKRSELIKSQITKLKELIIEAKRKFDIRKISLDRYLNFRNQLFSRELELIRTRKLSFTNALVFMKQFHLDPGYCYE